MKLKSLIRAGGALLAVAFLGRVAWAQNPVTFQVNMSIQKQIGNFNPAAHIVVLRGSFHNEAGAPSEDWHGNFFQLSESATPDVYTLTVNITTGVGTQFEYKFVIEDAAMAGNLTTQTGNWESRPNRTFTLQSGGQILDVVYFNDQSTTGLTATVLWKADMSELINNGWFDPASDSIVVTGSFDGWSKKGPKMEPSFENPLVYEHERSITEEVGRSIAWKFKAFPDAKFGNTGWETGSDHTFPWTGQDITIGPQKPLIRAAARPITRDVTVRFSVDVRNATERFHNRLFDNIKSVWMQGEVQPLKGWSASWAVADSSSLIRLYDDGTHGDAKARDGVWTTEVLFPNGTPSGTEYKYAIYADGVDTLNRGVVPLDNEAGFAENHYANISDTQPLAIVPQDKWASQKTFRNGVTFRVDMSIQKLAGNFDPARHLVVVRGSFHNESIPNLEDWKGNVLQLSPQVPGSDLYQLTVDFLDTANIGRSFEYKFVIEDTARYTDRTTQAGNWESRANRTFTLARGGQVLDVVFFNDQSSLPATADVTFIADMAELITNGWFDPAADSIVVTGSFDGWSKKGPKMEASFTDPLKYETTVRITEGIGNQVAWKFKAFPDAKFGNTGWETGSDHKFTWTGQALTIGPQKPAIRPAATPITRDVTVRFSVDVAGATDWPTLQPFQNIRGVYMQGEVQPLKGWSVAWTIADTGSFIKLYDNGTHGDAVAGDQIWTTEVLFPTGTPSGTEYKYGIYAAGVDTFTAATHPNGPLDNEAGFAQNHYTLISDAQPLYIVPTDKWGSPRPVDVKSKPTVSIPTAYRLGENYPNPFNPSTSIDYDVPKAGRVTLAIYNLMGQKIATLVDGLKAPGSYRATWSAVDDQGRRVASGIYVYRLEAQGFSATKKMLLLK